MPGADVFALAGAGLSLLTAEAEYRPVLVVVDDIHWIDQLSSQAMAFTFRRLYADRIAVVLAGRDGEQDLVPGPWQRLEVGGLPIEESTRLIHQSTDRPVNDRVREQPRRKRLGGTPW